MLTGSVSNTKRMDFVSVAAAEMSATKRGSRKSRCQICGLWIVFLVNASPLIYKWMGSMINTVIAEYFKMNVLVGANILEFKSKN